MGLGGISIWQLLIILIIVLLLFGTKKLRGLGSDLGGAIRGFKNAVSDDEQLKDTETGGVGEDAAEDDRAGAHNRENKPENSAR